MLSIRCTTDAPSQQAPSGKLLLRLLLNHFAWVTAVAIASTAASVERSSYIFVFGGHFLADQQGCAVPEGYAWV